MRRIQLQDKTGAHRVLLFLFATLGWPVLGNADEASLRVSMFGEPSDVVGGEGRVHAGEDSVAFDVTDEGDISVSEPARMLLPGTWGRSFFLQGEVNLGGTYQEMRFSEDLASGFTVFAREIDSRHRYELNPTRIRTKRRGFEGRDAEGIRTLERFEEPATGQWHGFFVLATEDRMVFQFAGRISRIEGPLELDGENSIGLAPGTKVRGLSLSILDEGTPSLAHGLRTEPDSDEEIVPPATIDIMIRIRATR